jgi:hypothetical protein
MEFLFGLIIQSAQISVRFVKASFKCLTVCWHDDVDQGIIKIDLINKMKAKYSPQSRTRHQWEQQKKIVYSFTMSTSVILHADSDVP